MDFELERFMHLYAMNRGILLTPFHNMALMSPQTDASDVDQHTRVFREGVKELVAWLDDPTGCWMGRSLAILFCYSVAPLS